jgi:esterase/lipase
VSRQSWVEIVEHCKAREENYGYVLPTVQFCVVKIGMKMLSIGLIDDALHIAFRLNNQRLISAANTFAHKQRNPLLVNLIDYHQETENPNYQSSMVKAMTQIANFSQKQLKKEDFMNLYKDFETLLKIDDITDLELTDFNGWDINLEDY